MSCSLSRVVILNQDAEDEHEDGPEDAHACAEAASCDQRAREREVRCDQDESSR
jgi:hypothetical protein